MNNTIMGSKKEEWYVDNKVKKLALKVLDENSAELGYIDPDKIVFASVDNGGSLGWLGKCYRLVPAMKLIPYFMLERIHGGDVEAIDSFDEELLDVRFVIAINRDAIHASTVGDPDKVTEIVMHHELKHIDPEMIKIVEHDTKDFKSILERYGVNWSSGLFKDEDGIEESS